MAQTRSVDDLLVRVQNEQSGIDSPQPQVAALPDPEPKAAEQEPEAPQPQAESVPEGHDTPVPEAKAEKAEEGSKDPYAATDESAGEAVAGPIDEYGNPVEKPKTYTEEDVQRMIRERLARGRQPEQPVNQQVQKAAENFQSDPNSDESWEVQLKNFIKKTNDEIRQEEAETNWRAQEAAKQAEFETKFTAGMGKYQDFHQVTSGKAITQPMMVAARNLENPAAFVYAASKMHPQELQRIANIPDAGAQMMEVGRLHERMVRESRSVSAAPKPVAAVKGDMPVKQHEQPSIDQRIIQHAKQKFARK